MKERRADGDVLVMVPQKQEGLRAVLRQRTVVEAMDGEKWLG